MGNKDTEWHKPHDYAEAPNMVRYFTDYGAISYNPKSMRTTEWTPEFEGILTPAEVKGAMDGAKVMGLNLEEGILEETALVDDRDDKNIYYILKGDFRVEFSQATTWAQAMVVYNELAPKYRSDWSNEALDEARAKYYAQEEPEAVDEFENGWFYRKWRMALGVSTVLFIGSLGISAFLIWADVVRHYSFLVLIDFAWLCWIVTQLHNMPERFRDVGRKQARMAAAIALNKVAKEQGLDQIKRAEPKQ